jgi:inner membrane protein
MEKSNRFAEFGGRYALVIKIAFIGILMLFLLLPISMIERLVFEREARSREAEDNIVGMGGGEVTLSGPILNIPFVTWAKGEKGERIKQPHVGRFLPDDYKIAGEAKPEQRNRGIYQVILYTSTLEVSGTFTQPDFSSWGVDPADILWNDAYVSVEMPDLRIVTDKVRLVWDGSENEFAVGAGNIKLFNGEIRSGVGGRSVNRDHAFQYSLHIRGGKSLNFLPYGNSTKVTIRSGWQSPNFSGGFLPTDKHITKSGFDGTWQILAIARNYPSRWRDFEVSTDIIHASTFGVELMIPVDRYLKSSRSIKYAVLFIIVPFLAFFLFEVIAKRRVHPFQYLLVGVAICIFYLLLLSLSEHIPFNAAYVVSALATTLLITCYSSAVLAAWKKAFVIASVLAVLYVFLFFVLLSEDYALLIGALGMFAVIAVVMYITRKIDWYAIRKSGADEKMKSDS